MNETTRTANRLDKMIEFALESLAKIAPGYNPLSGHVHGNHRDGSSLFKTINTIEELIVAAKAAKLYRLHPGDHGAVCLVFQAEENIGEETISKPVPGETYEMIELHGCLQPVGEITTNVEPTQFFSLVFTLEDVEGQKRYCLASAFPGWPDDGAERDGLKCGDILSAEDVIDRRLRPKAKHADQH